MTPRYPPCVFDEVFGGLSETAYSATKAGLPVLASDLTSEYADEGVRFNVVRLGTIIGGNKGLEERDVEKDNLDKLYPLGRTGTTEDAANAVLFLLSDKSKWITGEVLTVDGGLTATGNFPDGEWWK